MNHFIHGLIQYATCSLVILGGPIRPLQWLNVTSIPASFHVGISFSSSSLLGEETASILTCPCSYCFLLLIMTWVLHLADDERAHQLLYDCCYKRKTQAWKSLRLLFI